MLASYKNLHANRSENERKIVESKIYHDGVEDLGEWSISQGDHIDLYNKRWCESHAKSLIACKFHLYFTNDARSCKNVKAISPPRVKQTKATKKTSGRADLRLGLSLAGATTA